MSGAGRRTAVAQPWWRRPVGVEVLANLAVILVIPAVVGPLLARLNGPLRGLGLGSLLDVLASRNYFSDIGIEVAAALGLRLPEYGSFDVSAVLGPLIGMAGGLAEPHSHPPTSLVLWLPLTWVPYATWLPYFAVASVCALAGSMRLVGAPRWVAYPVAAGIGIHPDWLFSLGTTYPLTALAIAAAWHFRARQGAAGVMYGLLAATRGYAAVLVVYPLVRRQWRALLVAAAVVLGTLAVAIALEPESVRSFLTAGRAETDYTMTRADLFTLSAVFGRHGLPEVLGWALAAAVGAVAVLRRNDLFWELYWASLAVTPIAWMQTTVVLLPLFVLIYRSGVVGRVVVLVAAAVLLGPLSAGVVSLNVIWPFALGFAGLGLILSPVRFDPGMWPNREAGEHADPSATPPLGAGSA